MHVSSCGFCFLSLIALYVFHLRTSSAVLCVSAPFIVSGRCFDQKYRVEFWSDRIAKTYLLPPRFNIVVE